MFAQKGDAETHMFTLLSVQEFGIVEMTGVEEDLFTNRRLIKTGETISQFFANCISPKGTMGPHWRESIVKY